MDKRHSFPYTAEQLVQMYQNSQEILAKLDQAMTSDTSTVLVDQVDPRDGSVSTTEIPTLGSMYSRLAKLEENFNILSGINGNAATVHIANNAYKRILLADVNLEPNDLSKVDAITTFKTDKNWFFDALTNPTMSVELDLTGKVQQGVRKVLSRRFIVKFDKDQEGVLTDEAQQRELEFNTKYKGRNDIDITEFVTWHQNAIGLMNRTSPLLDEQMFDLEPQRLRYNGVFTILGTEIEPVAKKLWYKLNTLAYQDISNPTVAPVAQTLAVGDQVAVVPNISDQMSTTVYQVAEISTVNGIFRVRFELLTGQDPIPVRVNALKMYSPVVYDKRVRITIGFDEYDVVFIKPLEADNHLLARNWSKGTGFYTNDLELETKGGQTLNEFYVQQVYDYGAILQDLVAKKIPNMQGIQPLPPNLDPAKFKVVQINKHLTDSADADQIRELYQQMTTYRSEVDALQAAVSNKQKYISTKRYASEADRTADMAELNQLGEQSKSKNTLMATVLQKILQQKKNINDISPKFRARGFWAMPDPIETGSTDPQEVVQFEVQYRYKAKSGSQPQTVQFDVVAPLNTADYIATNRGTSAPGTANPTDNATAGKDQMAAYSTWNRVVTAVRERVYNGDGSYSWAPEDLTNADAPNINQLDIPISQGELVEVRIRSLSEVGWPDSPLTSEWSATVPIVFPDEFNSLMNNDEFILSEATQEDQRLRFVKELEALNILRHVSSSFVVGDKYYTHSASDIASGLLDINNNVLSVYDVIRTLQADVAALKEAINRAKGELRVRLFKGDLSQTVANNGEITFKVNLEDYAELAKFGPSYSTIQPNNVRTYVNKTYVIDDFYLVVDNTAAENSLGLFSTRTYSSATNASYTTPFALPVASGDATIDAAQPLWVDTEDNLIVNPVGVLNNGQVDNQWIWLEHSNTAGQRLYAATTVDGVVDTASKNASITANGVNCGLPVGSTGDQDADALSMMEAEMWSSTKKQTLGLSVHPQVTSLSSVVDTGTDKTRLVLAGETNGVRIPIKLYTKFDLFRLPEDLFGTTAADWPHVYGSDYVEINNVGYRTISVHWPPATAATSQYTQLNVGDIIILNGVTKPTEINGRELRVLQRITFDADFGSPGFNDIGLVLDYPYRDAIEGGYIVYIGKDASLTQTYPQFSKTASSHTTGGVISTVVGERSGVIQSYVKPGDSAFVQQMYAIKSNGASPKTLRKSVRFYMEPSTIARPFEFTVNFEVTQFKDAAISRGI
jgi:hypothetical protein